MNNLTRIDEQIKELSALKRIVKRGEVSYRGETRNEDALRLEHQLTTNGLEYKRTDFKNFIVFEIENEEDATPVEPVQEVTE